MNVFRSTIQGLTLLSLSITLLIFLFLGIEFWSALSQKGFLIFFQGQWNPSEGFYQIGPMVLSTLLISCAAVFIAAPIAIGTAFYAVFIAPRRLASVLLRTIEILSGLPSVVYGLWGLLVVVPFINDLHPPGPSFLAASVILAIMVLPIGSLIFMEQFKSLPVDEIMAAETLGLSRYSVIRAILIPRTSAGILTGIFLQVGRALGETMAVVMVAGNVPQLPQSIFDPIRTLTANIALEMAYATGFHRSALMVSGGVLLIMTSMIFFMTKTLAKSDQYV